MMRMGRSIALLTLAASLACGGAEGTLRINAYGESFIESGIPADEMNDGWAIEFERFSVSISDVILGGVSVEVADTIDLAQLSGGSGHELGRATLPEGNYGDARFTLAGLEIDGVATRGGDVRNFSWVFPEAISYDDCDARTRIESGGTSTFEITIHADHLFYDSLVAEAPGLRFQPLADADGDADGDVTPAELELTDIGGYDPGSEGGIDNLWQWLVAATRTVGHVQGEGHCEAVPANEL